MTLEFEISEMEECIKIGEKAGKDMSYEKSLVKHWRWYLKGGKYHYKWLQHIGHTERDMSHRPPD